MSKCDVSVLGLYERIFQDAKRAFPALEQELSKDYFSLRHAVRHQGLWIVTIGLVAVGKHFDRCLAAGMYTSSELPLTKRRGPKNVLPRFLGGLMLRVFDCSGSLKADASIEAIFFIRQILLFMKKANFECAQEAISTEVERFIEHDESLPLPTKSWNAETGDVETCTFSLLLSQSGTTEGEESYVRRALDLPSGGPGLTSALRILDRVSGILTSVLGSFDPRDWRFRHGPGAVSEGSRFYLKYPNLGRTWDLHLESEFPIADYGFHSFASWSRSTHDDHLQNGEPTVCRLCAVPKSIERPRLIAAEPTAKQWCQQNLLDYFVTRVKGSWISKFLVFDDQTQNQELAKRGSMDGSLCTIDLSAASDSVTCAFVGSLFRANPPLLRALRAVRTRHLSQAYAPNKPAVLSLRKYSMMGSAVTFPVESIGFLAICIAGVLHARNIKPSVRSIKALIGEVSVYGDDLVIPRDSWDDVVRLLEFNHFKVNTDKSFREGNFRESCGVDCFRGWGVTPVYYRGPYTSDPESIIAQVALRNHFYSRFLVSAASEMDKLFVGSLNFPHISSHSGAVGLHSRLPVVLPGIPRFCRSHHVWKTKVLTLSGRGSVAKFDDESALLQYFTESPSPFTKWEHGVRSRLRLILRRRWMPVRTLTGKY